MGSGLNDVGAHCPQCGAEYRVGFDTCADCGVPLVPGPPPFYAPEPETAPRQAVVTGAWKPLTRRSDEEARLLAGLLESAGIPTTLDPPWQSGVYGTHGVTVLVPEDRVLEAGQIVEEIRSSPGLSSSDLPPEGEFEEENG